MSYDILFVPAELLGSADPMTQLLTTAAEHPNSALSADQRSEWDRVIERLTAVLPDAELHTGEDQCLLADAESGIRLMQNPIELALSVPAWHTLDTGGGGGTGSEAHNVLQRVAAAVENVTGLVAYDMQTRAPFVGGASGRRVVRESGDSGRLDSYVGSHESGHLIETSTAKGQQDNGGPGLWRRIFGGR